MAPKWVPGKYIRCYICRQRRPLDKESVDAYGIYEEVSGKKVYHYKCLRGTLENPISSGIHQVDRALLIADLISERRRRYREQKDRREKRLTKTRELF